MTWSHTGLVCQTKQQTVTLPTKRYIGEIRINLMQMKRSNGSFSSRIRIPHRRIIYRQLFCPELILKQQSRERLLHTLLAWQFRSFFSVQPEGGTFIIDSQSVRPVYLRPRIRFRREVDPTLLQPSLRPAVSRKRHESGRVSIALRDAYE